MKQFKQFIPTKLLFGAGSLNELANQQLPGKKALLIISNGKSAKANGYLSRTEGVLSAQKKNWVIFDEIEANPLKSTVMRGAKIAREFNCDFIVALGGGSVMDASKGIAAMATNDGDLWDYISGGTGKGKPLGKNPLPIVAITTTAGTGSEVDAWGVITNPETNEKIGFGGDERLFPMLSVVDPELMLSVPPKFTAYQGFDALFHSTEVYIGKFSSLISDMYCGAAIKAIAKYLPKAVNDGGDIRARTEVAYANTMSGYAMVVGCTTSEHSLEHAMSAYHQDLPHGAGLIMISKAYYEHFISTHACDNRFIEMAKLMGNNNANMPNDFIDCLVALQKSCGVDNLNMSDYGIHPSEFKTMAQNARETMGALFTADPCDMSVEDCITIYEKSYR